jgi:hypothetical protein
MPTKNENVRENILKRNMKLHVTAYNSWEVGCKV